MVDISFFISFSYFFFPVFSDLLFSCEHEKPLLTAAFAVLLTQQELLPVFFSSKAIFFSSTASCTSCFRSSAASLRSSAAASAANFPSATASALPASSLLHSPVQPLPAP